MIALLVPLLGFGFTFAKFGLGVSAVVAAGMRFVLAGLVLVWFVPKKRLFTDGVLISFIAATLRMVNTGLACAGDAGGIAGAKVR